MTEGLVLARFARLVEIIICHNNRDSGKKGKKNRS